MPAWRALKKQAGTMTGERRGSAANRAGFHCHELKNVIREFLITGENIMALYAFDGTWNEDEPLELDDSNVVKFRDSYIPAGNGDNRHYIIGIGTGNVFDRVLGGLFGRGGKERVREAINLLRQSFAGNDRTIDIVGFSRGAALALDFANVIARQGVAGVRYPRIRFLGLWDAVGSFGMPGNDIDIGYNFAVPNNVAKCYHAQALDEQRWTFDPIRLIANMRNSNAEGRVFETWFRGVHSDIGGGNRNVALSNIGLCWMLQNAIKSGVPIDKAKIPGYRADIIADAAISQNLDPIKNAWRTVRYHDTVHNTVSWRKQHNNPPQYLDVVDDDGPIGGGGFADGINLPDPAPGEPDYEYADE